jgi:hypothetical protein
MQKSAHAILERATDDSKEIQEKDENIVIMAAFDKEEESSENIKAQQ